MQWINIYDQAPEDGQEVLTYFDVFDNIEIHKYKNVSNEEDGIFGAHCFYNHKGFLTDDIVYWMPLPSKPPAREYEEVDDEDS